MKAPLSWIREYTPIAVAAEVLGQDLTKIGLELGGLTTHGADTVLDFEVTTNRVDCMNVIGLAREAAVRYGLPLQPPAADVVESGAPAGELLRVVVEAPELCPFFAARVLEVRIGPSPEWLRARLEAVGVRSINNVVDLTNYVMLETGQPSHAFDLDRLPAAGLCVRWAVAGERLTTLDGIDRELSPRNGLVAALDGTPLALAGVMGGAASEVHAGTRRVALEAAYWNPLATRRSAKGQGLHTEASHRFERGADPAATLFALDRIAHLVVKLGIGSVRPGVVTAGALPGWRRVDYRPARASRVVGAAIPEAQQRRILGGLGFDVEGDGPSWRLGVPSWRGDVTAEIDVVEEVARHFGVDNVPATLPPATRPGRLRDEARVARRVREVLTGAGLFEAISLSMVADAAQADVAQARVRLANPLSEAGDGLRASIAVPGLLQVLQHNQRQGRRDLRFFEQGAVYAPGATPEARPSELRRVAIALSGPDPLAHWSGRRGAADFAELRGVVDGLAVALGAAALSWQPEGAPGFLHPGQSASLHVGGTSIGWAGALHPERAAALDLRDGAYLAELDLGALAASRGRVRYAALPRFPSVGRDIAIVCPPGLSAAAVEAIIRTAAGPALRHVAFVDRYAGPPVPAGHVSLTLSLRFADADRTLVGEEVQRGVEAAVQALAAAGAEIRGV